MIKMKGLRKYLTPFAPDQSGAVSMCYALGGMVVIVDAGGCAGNICGFDEPRWQPDYLQTFGREGSYTGNTEQFGREGSHTGNTAPFGLGDCQTEEKAPHHVAAVFSAGLRDMDAILGRDDLLIKKLEEAAKKIDAKFIALIGTPVPAVIGTDLAADAVMAGRRTHLPCIAVSTDGMHLYDRGIEEALLALVKTFAGETTKEEKSGSHRKTCGVLGLNPLDLFDPAWTEAIRNSLLEKGYDEVLLYGMEGGLDALKRSSLAERNYVISTAGIAAAEYLKERFGIPYEVAFPADPLLLLEENPVREAKSTSPDAQILVVHQQVLANSIRERLMECGVSGSITAATWFDMKEELALSRDIRLKEEDDFIQLASDRKWDMIIADPALRPMARSFQGKWIDAYHFAVSGQAAIDRSREKRGRQEGCRI